VKSDFYGKCRTVRVCCSAVSASGDTGIPESLHASFFRVIIAVDQVRPASVARRGFQAPLNLFAEIALALKKVEDFWWIRRWLVRIKRFIFIVVIRTNR